MVMMHPSFARRCISRQGETVHALVVVSHNWVLGKNKKKRPAMIVVFDSSYVIVFSVVSLLLWLLVDGCSISFWWLMIILGGLKMFSLWKRKPPWFTPNEIDDGEDDAYWGAENKSARTHAMRSNQRVRCTDVRWAMGKTIAENLFYTFNFPQFFLQDFFSIIEKEFCKCFIYLTCLLIWPWGRLMI